MSRAPLLSGLVMLALLGCGGGSGNNSFTVEPESRTVTVGDHLPLYARPVVDLSGDPDWEVQELYGGGLRNSQGEATVYFAPEAAGTYHLVLRATRSDGRALKQIVEIRVLPIATLEPATVILAPGGSATFTATMKGLGRNTVKWGVEESGGGEIDPDGRYLAPAKAGTYHVTATSTLDPSVSVQATVVVD